MVKGKGHFLYMGNMTCQDRDIDISPLQSKKHFTLQKKKNENVFPLVPTYFPLFSA